MNLYQQNLAIDPRIISNVRYDLKDYFEFINSSIEFLKKETYTIKVNKSPFEGEFKYSPISPTNKKEDKAIELLFSENTKSVYGQNKRFDRTSEISFIDRNQAENYVVLREELDGDVIYLKPDTYQLEQQKKALEALKSRPLPEHKPLLSLFDYPDSGVWQQNYSYQELPWKILTDNNSDGVLEQREFVSKAINTEDFALLEGPPGSGKTTTIIELIIQFAAEGKRVLLCSATHAAIDNVIERIMGRYKDICYSEIVPVRISRMDNVVKESVRPYLLKNLEKTYKSKISKHLIDNQELDSQKYLLSNLNKKESSGTDPVEKIILDSANLVAGTMVGILQHPDIKAQIQGASFDVLIIDEASKVTFSEFIVPALHAKKWILVGDVKQLSPYVEDDYVGEYISKLLDEDTQKTLVGKDENWSDMVASRLSQSFSFRNSKGFEDIDKELEKLIPSDLKDKIEKLKRLVFPSILELLQNGIGTGINQHSRRVLSHGFDEEAQLSRFVSLTYQHRMHPAIAQTSKVNCYDGSNLLPANTVLVDRGWRYENEEPVKWVSNNDASGNKGGKIINPTELNDIKRELEKFLDWALNNPKPDGSNYEVAVLSFYLDQEAELRKMIRKITKQPSYSKFHKNNTEIYLYTVDKFQGQEADLVLLGFTKFTKNAHYNSPNRLNVALTRARHKLILFGNKQWFKEKAKLKALNDLASNYNSTLKIGK